MVHHGMLHLLGKPWPLTANTVSALSQLSVPGQMITAHNVESLTLNHHTVENAIAPLLITQMLDNAGEEFTLHGNNHPYTRVSFPNCSFEHSYLHCMNYPNIVNKCHKARFSPYQSSAEHNCGPNFNRRPY